MAKAKANGGGVVRLRGGHYVESVSLENFRRDGQKIVVRPDGGGEVFIDSMLPEFLAPEGPDDQWFKVIPPGGIFKGEYVWGRPYEPPGGDVEAGRVKLGAFLDEPVHTRLVSYDRVEDLTAPGQVWPDDLEKGNRVWRLHPDQAHFPDLYKPEERVGKAHYRPWVYMGPGIWFDQEVRDDAPGKPRSGGRRIHIRLAPTTNNIPGWPDYDPETTDPNQVRLALSREGEYAIFLKHCNHIRFENLTLRFGSPDTVRLNACRDIVFDHCRIRSGSRAINLLAEPGFENRDVRVEHCVIDGGIPTWLFRGDRKGTYLFGPDAPDTATATRDELSEDKLGYSTSGVQMSGDARNAGVIVHHCELFNAHDSYVFGDGMEFHHNWVHNLNDDGIAVSARAKTKNAKIYCNVMTQCLTALSFAAPKVGPVYIYGNLFDLREPTLGRRPTGGAVPDSLRQGHFFKDGADEGPIYLFHNTCLVLDPGAKEDDLTDLSDAGFSYYATIGKSKPRQAFNNIMVVAYTAALNPIAFLAPKSFACKTNGNVFFRIPQADTGPPNFRVRRRGVQAEDRTFADLKKYRDHYWPDGIGAYEKDSTLKDPLFKSFDTVTGTPHRGDDLRLRIHPKSPAKGTATPMPQDLHNMYVEATGTEPADRGCYPSTGARLQVGVDGRRVYPRMRPGPRPDTHPGDTPPVVVEDA